MSKPPFVLFVPGIKAFPHPEMFTSRFEFPRGALCLASYLRANGEPAVVIPLDHYMTATPDPRRVKAQIDALVDAVLQEFRPRVVGSCAPYTMLYPTARRVLARCKELDPTVSTGIGGPHATYTHRQVLEDAPEIDWVVRGEGEQPLLDIVRAVASGQDLSGVAGVTWRSASGIAENPPGTPLDLRALPPLDYTLLPPEFVRKLAVHIIASRGCAYRCTYCTESKFFGHDVRTRDPGVVVDEIRTLNDVYGNPPVGFEDSMFDHRTPWFHQLMADLEEVPLRPGFALLTRVDTVTPDGFAAMRRAGIHNVLFGVENLSPRVLKMMAKRTTPAVIEHGLGLARDADMVIGTFWLFGHPGDSPQETAVTLAGLERLYRQRLVHTAEMAMFVPYPGTIFYSQPERFGVRILHFDWERWGRFNTEPVAELEDYPQAALKAGFERAIALLYRWQVENPTAPGPIGAYFEPDQRGEALT